MTQPTPEAYEAAARRWILDPERTTIGMSEEDIVAATKRVAERNDMVRNLTNAVWPLAEAAGYHRAVQALRDRRQITQWEATARPPDKASGWSPLRTAAPFAADYLESLAAAPREDTT